MASTSQNKENVAPADLPCLTSCSNDGEESTLKKKNLFGPDSWLLPKVNITSEIFQKNPSTLVFQSLPIKTHNALSLPPNMENTPLIKIDKVRRLDYIW